MSDPRVKPVLDPRMLRDTVREMDVAGADLEGLAGDGRILLIVDAPSAYALLDEWRSVLAWARHVVTALELVCVFGTIALVSLAAFAGLRGPGWLSAVLSAVSLLWFIGGVVTRRELVLNPPAIGMRAFPRATAAVMAGVVGLVLILDGGAAWLGWAGLGVVVSLAHYGRLWLAAEQLRRLALIDPDSRREMVRLGVVTIRHTGGN